MSLEDLANNIKTFTGQFEAHLKRHGAYDKACSFELGSDYRQEGLNICNTPACHGGEIAIMYDEMGGLYENPCCVFFENGAQRLAENLGFESSEDLTEFFDQRPEYWGGDKAMWMFDSDGEIAFGKEEGDSVTLREILDWWEAVAIRLKAVNPPKEI